MSMGKFSRGRKKFVSTRPLRHYDFRTVKCRSSAFEQRQMSEHIFSGARQYAREQRIGLAATIVVASEHRETHKI